MFSDINFWRNVGERALKTFFEGAGAALIAAGTGLVSTDWAGVLSVAGMSAIISVCLSIGSGATTAGLVAPIATQVLADRVMRSEAVGEGKVLEGLPDTASEGTPELSPGLEAQAYPDGGAVPTTTVVAGDGPGTTDTEPLSDYEGHSASEVDES
jgi:hypothetical protein